jgi:transcription elongation factor
MDEIALMREIGRLQEQINALRTIEVGGVWQSYTPVWTASTTNPAIGNGTLTGRYSVIGKTCIVNGVMTAGSTTTFGSGYWMFSVPYIPASGIESGSSLILDSGNVFMIGAVVFSGNVLTGRMHNNGNNLSASSPMTWAVNDRFVWNIVYQIA